MKHLLKFLKIAAILAVSALAVLFSVSLIMQDKAVDIILKSLNRNFLTKIETGSYRFSLIKKFPLATMELKNVIVFSSPDFNTKGFTGINTDTLLSARSAFIDFKIIDVLKGDYTFKSISVKSGRLNLFTDEEGRDNYDVSKGNGSKNGPGNTTLNLNRINLSDIEVVYNDRNAGLIIKSFFKNSRIKSRISGNDIDFDSNTGMILEYFELGDLIIRQSIPADLETGLSKTDKGVFFRKSTLGIENWDFILTGFIASDNYIDLTVSGKNIDIARITNYFPDRYKKLASEYHPSGILKLESTIKGVSSRTENPHYEVIWSLKDANIDHDRSRLKVDNFSFDGSYSNGARNKPETSTLAITNFTTRLGSAGYTGSFTISDFTKPHARLTFKGTLFPSELKEFLDLKNVESTGGSIGLDLKLSGNTGQKDKFRLIDLTRVSSNSELVFNSFRLKLANKNVDLRDVRGIIHMGERTSTNDLSFVFNDQKLNLEGDVINLRGWLAGLPLTLSGSATLSAPRINVENFTGTTARSDKIDAGNPQRASFVFPDYINLNTDILVDTLIYKTFTATKVSGKLTFQPRSVNIRSMNLYSQKGEVTGNGMIWQNANKSYISKGNFILSRIDVNETFTTFHNFGQNFLKAENINGTLSGSLSILIPVDSLLKPDIKSFTAEGKYTLTDGALINFDPVKELSSFIELSELSNIKFDNLENDFFIRSNSFYMPQMDVRSSAVDLSVNGKHGFNNIYEYHVKLLLSDILSNKARKTRTTSSEFGEVEDDGLGRTSILLMIEGNGDDVKVSYDKKAAGTQIRTDIQKEKQTLKKILNEEYGWYGSDVEPVKEKKTKPRFRIVWEGSDSSANDTEPPDDKKDGLFKNLFKKN
jgi:AsmA-like C-terminal region